MNRNTLLTFLVILCAGATAAWMFRAEWAPGLADHDGRADERHEASHAGHDHGHHAGDDFPRGPRGGRLLGEDDFSLEITVFEQGLPPEFHVYAYSDGRPLSPDEVDLEIELARLGGRVDHFDFSPRGDYLRGSGTVAEPHSFDVSVWAGYRGQVYRWHYDSYEGRTRIAEAMAREAAIATAIAGPVTLHETLLLTGRVQTDPDRLSRVRPRFPGVVQAVRRQLGEQVRAGDVLATVQSNESLQTYPVKAPIGGVIVRRDVQVGESTGDQPLFVIADLSTVWVELDVFGGDLARVQPGQAVDIETFDGYRSQGRIDWLSPLAAHASQSVQARVPLPNPEGRLRPGQFVRGQVSIAEHAVPLAVRRSALQRFRDFQVVFARFGDNYEVRMLDLGRRNRDWVEVLGGLEPGTEYVTANSYLIKADIEKSGASHDH